MNDDRTEHHTDFRDRLLAVDPPSADFRKHLEQELHAMFIRELTTPRRISYGVVSVAALVSAVVCATLAMTEPTLPPLARIGLGVGAFFGLAWAVVGLGISWRGTLDLQLDGRRIAAMVWVFTVLMMVFFLVAGMSTENRLLGVLMITQGLAFLICAAVYWLTYRIERSELTIREKLLQLELRIAQLSEKD